MRLNAKWFAAVFLGCAPFVGAGPITITSVGQFTLPSGTTDASELSGITYAGGNQYYAVSDGTHKFYPLSITLNNTTGAITAAALSAGTSVAGSDLEGVAYNATNASLYISDESGPNIRQHRISDGVALTPITVPAIYSNLVDNRSLESLSLGAGKIWTANEESLTTDGPNSTFTAGTLVRLQRFTNTATPVADGQWAYLTDDISNDIPIVTSERSGVSDVLALPDGRLLVMEREFGFEALPFRIRIYEVDFTSATDTSALPNLTSTTFTPVTKTLRWEMNFGSDNFEGITLGPTLADGSTSILLVSDNGGGGSQSLYALKITVPEPAFLTPLALSALALRRRRHRVL